MTTNSKMPPKPPKGIQPGEPGFYPDWTGGGGKKIEDGRKLHTEIVRTKRKPRRKADPKARKKGEYRRIPKDILAKAVELYNEGKWRDVLRGLYKYSIYRPRSKDPFYPGTSTRRNRVYPWGQEFLAGKVGIPQTTVWKWLTRFEEDGIILTVYHGYRGRGSSILELAYNDGHRVKNKGITTRRKKPPTV